MKKGMLVMFVVMFVSLIIAGQWDKELFGQTAFIKTTIGAVLDPTLGALMKWNFWVGFAIIIALTSFILTLTQKYLSDQEQLKEMKKEQKYLQEEMKKYKEHPEKLMELQKKQLEFFPRTFELTMKPLIFTSIPIILLFRWFSEYLMPKLGNWWILWYLIGSMIFSGLFRKWMDVA
jgi:uncharacterized membrane protein (DUF106 family)